MPSGRGDCRTNRLRSTFPAAGRVHCTARGQTGHGPGTTGLQRQSALVRRGCVCGGEGRRFPLSRAPLSLPTSAPSPGHSPGPAPRPWERRHRPEARVGTGGLGPSCWPRGEDAAALPGDGQRPRGLPRCCLGPHCPAHLARLRQPLPRLPTWNNPPPPWRARVSHTRLQTQLKCHPSLNTASPLPGASSPIVGGGTLRAGSGWKRAPHGPASPGTGLRAARALQPGAESGARWPRPRSHHRKVTV